MLKAIPLILVLFAGLFLLLLAGAAFVAPDRARRFLFQFASTARAHFWELGLRALAGAAFVLQAPAMRYPTLFTTFGWLLVGTTLVLLVAPWRWHHAFAQRTLPPVTKQMLPLGLVSLALGATICYAALAR